MSNPFNNGTAIGRLARDPQVFDNTNGSKKIIITVMVDDNFRSGPEKKAKSHGIPIETYIAPGAPLGGWGSIHKGDLIGQDYRVDTTPYTKNGEKVYPITLVAEGFPQFLESKSVVDARRAANIAEANKAAQAEAAPAAAAPTAEESELESLRRQVAEAEAKAAGAAPANGVDYGNTAPFGG